MKGSKNIPDHILPTGNSSFIIRPVLKEINKSVLDEKAHRHRFQELIYIKSGTGSHFIDDNTIELKERSFYFIGLNQVHGFNYGKNLDGVLLRFDEDFLPVSHAETDILRDYTNTILLKNELQLCVQDQSRFELLLDLMLKENSSSVAGKQTTMQYLLYALLNKLTNKLLEALNQEPLVQENRDRQLFNKFNLLCNQSFTQEHNLQFYAQNLGITVRRLSDICMKYSGKTGKSIILEKIISEIKRYLKFSTFSIKEIAFRLSFDDPAYMSRIFKRYTNTTLSGYRKLEQSKRN